MEDWPVSRPTIGQVYTKVEVIACAVERLEKHAEKTNGSLEAVEREQLIMQGALGALKMLWVVAIGLAGLAATVTAIIVTFGG